MEDMILCHHGIKGQKWGVRRYQNLDGTLTDLGKQHYSKRVNRLARDIYSKAFKKERKITSDVRTSAKTTGCKLYGLEHKLKTYDSISRKIVTDSKEKNISLEDSAKGIKDAVRYTTISNDDDFVKNYVNFKKALEQKGYKEERCKNYFALYNEGKVKHKSVQSTFSDKDGYVFEVQFHTPSSQDAKNKKIPLYEERRKVGNSPSLNAYLEKKMVDLAEAVTTPKDIERINSH